MQSGPTPNSSIFPISSRVRGSCMEFPFPRRPVREHRYSPSVAYATILVLSNCARSGAYLLNTAVSLLVISGPVGVGKTTVGESVSEMLDKRGLRHGLIDTDSLNRFFPRSPEDRFAEGLMVANLTAISPNFVAAGATHIILTGVVESPDHLRSYQRAAGADSTFFVRLRASPSVLKSRLIARESGTSLEWHLNRAVELSAQMDANPFEDILLDTDHRSPEDVAKTIIRSWVDR
jgi:adenylylsulfate kinase-like enzyme